MLKSVISGLVAASMLATPVVAEARGGDREHRVERSHGDRNHDRRSDRRHRRGIDGGDIALGLGALILGTAIGSSTSRQGDRYYDDGYYDDTRYNYRRRARNRRHARNCYTTVVTRYNRRGERRQYRERRCY